MADLVDKRERGIQAYSLLRTARLNVLYYEHSLARATFWIRAHDFAVALAGISSPLAFLKRSADPFQTQWWFYLTLIAGLAGVLKPILRLDRQVALYSELVNHYRELFSELKCLTEDMSSARDFSQQLEKKFISCRMREADIQKKEPPPDSRKIKRLQRRVELDYDMNKIWLPEQEHERSGEEPPQSATATASRSR